MSRARANVVMPANVRPRGLKPIEAATYVGVSLATFEKLVREGTYPAPVRFGRIYIYDRRALDRAMDALYGRAGSGVDPLDALDRYEARYANAARSTSR